MTPRHRKAFTLIELLTVIAIIGILAAILIPTVAAVRQKARAAQSMSNLRELARAALLYTDEHRGFLPGSSIMGREADWTRTLLRYVNFNPENWNWDNNDSLSPDHAFNVPAVYRSPAVQPSNRFCPDYVSYQISYWASRPEGNLGGVPRKQMIRMSDIKAPAQTYFFAGVNNASGINPRYGLWPWTPQLLDTNRYGKDRVVMAWMDGHASIEPRTNATRQLSRNPY